MGSSTALGSYITIFASLPTTCAQRRHRRILNGSPATGEISWNRCNIWAGVPGDAAPSGAGTRAGGAARLGDHLADIAVGVEGVGAAVEDLARRCALLACPPARRPRVTRWDPHLVPDNSILPGVIYLYLISVLPKVIFLYLISFRAGAPTTATTTGATAGRGGAGSGGKGGG